MAKKFLEHFPPPQYLDPLYAGIAFSENCVRILVLDKKNKHPIFFDETDLVPGVIEKGIVKNEQAITQLLADKRALLKTPFVHFAIPDEASYVFTTKIPVVAGKDASESIGFILEDNVPLPLSDISFDFSIQSMKRVETDYRADAAVVAASTSIIGSYLSAIQKAGLECIRCTNESEAVVHAAVSSEWTSPSIVVHVHRQSAGIFIASNRVVEFSGVIQLSATDPAEVRASFIKAELLHALEYWSDKSGERERRTLEPLACYLCGRHELLQSVSLELAQVPAVRVSTANIWQNVFSLEEFVPSLSFEESLRFAPAVGLFLSN